MTKKKEKVLRRYPVFNRVAALVKKVEPQPIKGLKKGDLHIVVHEVGQNPPRCRDMSFSEYNQKEYQGDIKIDFRRGVWTYRGVEYALGAERPIEEQPFGPILVWAPAILEHFRSYQLLVERFQRAQRTRLAVMVDG